MARPKTAVVCNSKQDDDGFCLDDLSTFGPEAVAVLEEEKKTAQANRKDAEKRLTRVFPLPVAALAARCLVADPGKLTDAEKELASNFVSLRRVREEWESDLVVFYEWWRRGREFCDDLLSLAKRIEWAKFASLASRVLFEEDHDGRSKLDFCLQLRHLQKVRQNLEQLLPLTSLDNEDSYQFDANGLLQRSPVGLRGKLQQKELALEIRPSEIHISQVINRQFTEAVVNLLLQHLTEQTRARTFFRKATKKKKDISGIFTANDIETSYFDSTVMPFRSRGWWYVAVKPDIRHGWIVILLSSEAPKPPSWPKETKLLGLPDTVHDKPNSNFLVYPCLQALSFDLPRFCDALRQRQMCCSTDVPTAAAEAKDIVEAAVLRSRGEKASVEHDTVAKETQEAAETLAGLACDYPSYPSSKQNASGFDNTRADETRGEASRDNYLELVKGVPTRHDINTLDDGQWLNDVMVNFGLHVLGKRYSEGVFFYKTFLVEELQQGKTCAEWTKRANPAEYDYIVVPIHDPGRTHWLVAILWRSAPTTISVDANSFLIQQTPTGPEIST